MDQAAQETVASIVARETWTTEEHVALMKQLFAEKDAPRKFQAVLGELEASNPQPKGAVALKIGIGRYMLCRFPEALDVLADATDNKDRRYFQAMCYKNLRRYDKAVEELGLAKDRGWDAVDAELQIAETKALAGDVEGAEKILDKLGNRPAGQTAQFAFVRGLAYELSGRGEKAVEQYERARTIAPDHGGAAFRLAYYYDLHGEEQQAVDLYKQCLSHPPIHANALLNLAVLYEDAGKNDLAILCLRRILLANPNHGRARLFLKDAEAARNMYYDEEQARRVARRNAVMDIPVTDFELSVRARNCLKKMNIRTLGDLMRTSEAELLGYKNFGETSLKEIKDMLSAKGLRLGQAMDESVEFPVGKPEPRPAVAGNEGVLATPIEQVEFSIRVRRAIQGLKIGVLGDLAAKSEAELLGCKNFGQTSLNEVKHRLAEYGLKLREPE